MTIDLKAIPVLYDITGDIKDINTMLVPKQLLEAAEKDAARYRAIAADPYFDGYAWWTQDICIIESDDQSKPPTKAQVDEAIDAAMGDQK